MISLNEYLKIDPEKNKFDLPLSFFGHIKYLIIVKFLENLPFTDNLFIGEDKIKSYYWQIIINFLKKEFEANFSIYDSMLYNRFLQYSANFNIISDDVFLKNIKGHGNDSKDEGIATSKAVGEFLERYMTCMLSVEKRREIIKMEYGDIKKQVKIIRDFHGFNEQQLKNNSKIEIKDSDIFEVFPVEDLLDGKKKYYPLKQIMWNIRTDKEKTISNMTTSGSAGGFNVYEASLGAIYEAIERDSFFCYWLTKSTPEQIIINSGDIVEYDVYRKFLEETGNEIYILNTTTELGIPACLCVVINTKDKDISVSGGADISMNKAILKAINESRSCISILREKKDFVLPENYIPFFTKGIYRLERLMFWKNGANYYYFKFLIEGKKVGYESFVEGQKLLGDKKKEFEFLLSILSGKGYKDMYRFVSRDKRLEVLGYSVVRIIIPKLYQLYLDESLALTKSSRIDEFYEWKTGKKEWEINLWPHPFP